MASVNNFNINAAHGENQKIFERDSSCPAKPSGSLAIFCNLTVTSGSINLDGIVLLTAFAGLV
ncbi:hypothetical protein CCP3SC5AM1_1120006 [Gammaproteobacteria bacterium]